MENAVSFISDEHDKQKSELKKAREEVKQIQQKCVSYEQSVKQIQQHEESTMDKLLDLESRSMRDNLIFYGITETQSSGEQQSAENCEQLVKELITTKLHLDSTKMDFERAHRLGGARARKPRPIVVKFHRYQDREAVRIKSRDGAVMADLRGSNLGVGVQSPKQYRDARKALTEHAKKESDRGHRTMIIGNKLFVNNKPVKKYLDGNVIDC